MGFNAIHVYFTKPRVEVFSFFVISWVSERFLASGFSTCSGIWTIHTLHYQGCQAQRSQGTTRRLIHDRLLQDIWRRHFCLAWNVWREGEKSSLEATLSNYMFPSDCRVNEAEYTKFHFYILRQLVEFFFTCISLCSHFDEWVPILFVSCDQQKCSYSVDWRLVAVRSLQNTAMC